MTLAMETKTLIAICGPTAVGKTEYAIRAARALDGEVLSCDSMQLYKYMDIGSAKPTPEERAQVPHHLVDLIDPAEEFSVALRRHGILRVWASRGNGYELQPGAACISQRTIYLERSRR